MNAPHTPEFDRVEYRTEPSRYRHWTLAVDGPVATLAMNVDEDAGLRPGYKLKLNSYDLGVDIELHDALNRVRFEHPAVRTVVITSLRERIFCSGANIFMLGVSPHAWKVNFCKFTNETRNGIEDSSTHSGLKFLAAVNGACAGGGYELALACDEILLVDDRSSSVSLPEVPLLGVLPGTGGLTRLTDKRRPSSGGWWMRSPSPRASRRRSASARSSSPSRATGRPTASASRSRRSSAGWRPTRCTTPTCR
jgi:benzoyl-CoA-dihydrodiol lyase